MLLLDLIKSDAYDVVWFDGLVTSEKCKNVQQPRRRQSGKAIWRYNISTSKFHSEERAMLGVLLYGE